MDVHSSTRVVIFSALPDEQALFRIGLPPCGITPVVASTFEGVYAGLREAIGDVLLVDVDRQQDEAWALVRTVRREYPTLPIVILTAAVRPDGATRHRTWREGCAAFVAKPCALEPLVDVLVRAADGQRGLAVLDGGTMSSTFGNGCG